jgi:hypothetical protein
MRRYLPPQHGAWAMLVVPWAVGVACSRPVWLHLPLLVAWVGGYLLSYYALLAVKTRRPDRVASQLTVHGALTAVAATVVIVLRPAVLVFAPAFAVLMLVNVVAARRHADRALAGGLASVVQSCLMVPVAAVVAGADARGVVVPALVLLAYFVGSLLYVKTMIRNRGQRSYLIASIAVHAVAAAATLAVAWPLALIYTYLLARAAWLPRLTLTPKRVGLLEVIPLVALLVTLPLLAR